MLKGTLELHMNVHGCRIFMQDGASCHRTKIVSKFLKKQRIQVLDWSCNSLELNPIENLWKVCKVADKHPSGSKDFEKAMKTSGYTDYHLTIAVGWLKVCQDVWRWLLKTMDVTQSTDVTNTGWFKYYIVLMVRILLLSEAIQWMINGCLKLLSMTNIGKFKNSTRDITLWTLTHSRVWLTYPDSISLISSILWIFKTRSVQVACCGL